MRRLSDDFLGAYLDAAGGSVLESVLEFDFPHASDPGGRRRKYADQEDGRERTAKASEGEEER
jgi:hypothetical protein